LALLGELTNELKELDAHLVAMCDTHPQAVRLCMDRSRVQRTQEDWADAINMNRSQFKQAISTNNKRTKNLPAEKEEDLQVAAGNLAISQWRKLYRMGMLNCQRTHADQLAEAKALVARLEAGVA
jgi:hypothetical protein